MDEGTGESLEFRRKKYTFRVTEKEEEFLTVLAETANMRESDVIRHALIKFAEELHLEIPQGIFELKPGGNWTPKPKGKENRLLVEA